jgi:hypothetical protein
MNEQQLIKLLESAEGTIARLMLEVNRLSKEVEAWHNLVKEQEKKIIDLAFDLEYARRTDEFVKKAREK